LERHIAGEPQQVVAKLLEKSGATKFGAAKRDSVKLLETQIFQVLGFYS